MTEPELVLIVAPLSVGLVILVTLWILALGRARIASDLASRHQIESERAAAIAAREKNRADTQFAVIENAVNETKVVWAMYRKQSMEAGNAQAWLIRTLSELTQTYNRRAKEHGFEPYVVDNRLRAMVDTYNENHVLEENVVANKEKLLEEQRTPSPPGFRG